MYFLKQSNNSQFPCRGKEIYYHLEEERALLKLMVMTGSFDILIRVLSAPIALLTILVILSNISASSHRFKVKMVKLRGGGVSTGEKGFSQFEFTGIMNNP